MAMENLQNDLKKYYEGEITTNVIFQLEGEITTNAISIDELFPNL